MIMASCKHRTNGMLHEVTKIMYDSLDRMNLKNRDADLQRELREEHLAKEALKAQRKGAKNRGWLSVLANTLHIR